MKIKEAKAILLKECEASIAAKSFYIIDQSEMDDCAADIMSHYNNFEELMATEHKTCDQVLEEALEYVRNYNYMMAFSTFDNITRPCSINGKICNAPVDGCRTCSVGRLV